MTERAPGQRPGTTPYQGRCALCGGADAFVKYDFGRHRIYRCRACGLMWLHPQPSSEELGEVYGFDYYQNEKFFENQNETIYGYYDYLSERYIKQQNHDHLVASLRELVEGFEAGRSRFLDAGCGLGYLLDVAFDKDFDVEGIEYNPAAAQRIRRKFTFPVFCGDLMDYEGGPFDAVAMLDVIEHLPRPFESIRKVASLMKPRGVLMLSTMDSDSRVSRLMGKRLEDFRRTREHLFFFTRSTLTTALEREGFEIIRIDSYGLPIRMDFLTRRVKLALPRVGAALGWAIKLLHLSSLQFHFDPGTKMLMYARKLR
jgi:2-polyprenyl-3-methyl-5-hydroxy-6-metoxy-1,4-benzoquinol methylase